MQQLWDNTYMILRASTQQCLASEPTESKYAECCFQVSLQAWRRIKEHWKEKIHRSEKDEIIFFREIKPKFTSEIEYYLVLHSGLLFVPLTILEEQEYWQHESKRYKRFVDRNKDFVHYFESDRRFRDRDYFLQRSNKLDAPSQDRIYEDTDCRSSHDHLVRSLLANKHYYEYVCKRIAPINNE